MIQNMSKSVTILGASLPKGDGARPRHEMKNRTFHIFHRPLNISRGKQQRWSVERPSSDSWCTCFLSKQRRRRTNSNYRAQTIYDRCAGRSVGVGAQLGVRAILGAAGFVGISTGCSPITPFTAASGKYLLNLLQKYLGHIFSHVRRPRINDTD